MALKYPGEFTLLLRLAPLRSARYLIIIRLTPSRPKDRERYSTSSKNNAQKKPGFLKDEIDIPEFGCDSAKDEYAGMMLYLRCKACCPKKCGPDLFV